MFFVYLFICIYSFICDDFCLFLKTFQLVVGSEDFDIRVFREDEIIAEMTETEVIMYIITY